MVFDYLIRTGIVGELDIVWLSRGRSFDTGTERPADRFPCDGQLCTHCLCLDFWLLARSWWSCRQSVLPIQGQIDARQV